MSFVQWLLLILGFAIVAGAYWYIRRQASGDPWQGMDESAGNDTGRHGESLGGDSYVVGVRTVSPEAEASRATVGQGAPESSADPNDAAGPGGDVSAPDAGAARGAANAFAATATPTPAASSERVENMRPQTAPPGGAREIFLLHVAASGDRLFDGPDIHDTLQAQGLRFGLEDFYHRVTETNGVPESVFAVANMLKPGTLDPVDQDHLQTRGLTLFMVVPGPVDGVPAMRDMMETANAIAERLGGDVLDDKRALLKAQTARFMLDQIAELDRRATIARRR